MAKIKGDREHQKWEQDANSLTMKQAIFAHCYQCNGLEEGGIDCGGVSCPLYKFHPYNKNKNAKKRRELTEQQQRDLVERLQRARAGKNKNK